MRSRFLLGAALAVLAITAAACDSSRSTVPSTPGVGPARSEQANNANSDPVITDPLGTPKDTIPRGPLIGSGN